jgi:hypothetical protein
VGKVKKLVNLTLICTRKLENENLSTSFITALLHQPVIQNMLETLTAALLIIGFTPFLQSVDGDFFLYIKLIFGQKLTYPAFALSPSI